MRTSDAVLAAGAAARMTRFLVRDDLGYWTVKGPLNRVAERHVPPDTTWDPDDVDTWPKPLKAWHGLDCPWCTSVWVALGILGATAVVSRTRLAGPWRVLLGALTTSYVIGLAETNLDPE